MVPTQISAGAFLLPAFLLMFLPIQWVVAMVLAGAIHEICHIAAMRLLDVRIDRVSVGVRGAVIETEPMSPDKELICAIAGPLGSAALLLTARWFPRLAVCGVVHCIYNLLPLIPMDGGRVLRSMIFLLFRPGRSERLWCCSQRLIRIFVGGIIVFFAVKHGIIVLLLGIMILKTRRQEKPLANRSFWRYNKSNIDKGVQI